LSANANTDGIFSKTMEKVVNEEKIKKQMAVDRRMIQLKEKE